MRAIIAIFSAVFMTACQTTGTAVPTQAVLETADKESLSALKTTLAKAMNKQSVKLGAGDLTQSSVISVLPPRSYAPAGAPQNQAGNLALPTRFTLMMSGTSCYVVKDGTDETFPLEGVSCKPLI